MLLYLVRHGKAEDGAGDDRYRHLTERGRTDVRKLAETLGHVGIHVETVYHSGLIRAKETAAILHDTVGGQIEETSGLAPLDDVTSTARRLDNTTDRSMMLVGHQPFMGRLAAYLLSGDADTDFIHFRTASMASLSGLGRVWQLEWFLEPHVLKSASRND